MFFLNHPNIADIKARDLYSPPSSCSASPIIPGIAVVALFAYAHTFTDAEETSKRMAREHHACAVIMGLPQPGKLYYACTISLDHSLSELDQAGLVSTDRMVASGGASGPGRRLSQYAWLMPRNPVSPLQYGTAPLSRQSRYDRPGMPVRAEVTMSRSLLKCSLAILLAGCGTQNIASIERADQHVDTSQYGLHLCRYCARQC